jgi:hypothetical protein
MHQMLVSVYLRFSLFLSFVCVYVVCVYVCVCMRSKVCEELRGRGGVREDVSRRREGGCEQEEGGRM